MDAAESDTVFNRVIKLCCMISELLNDMKQEKNKPLFMYTDTQIIAKDLPE